MRKIHIPDNAIMEALQHKVDHKTKPQGSLGVLEGLAIKIGLIQQTLTPKLSKPEVVVFAGDHGIALEGVSAYPQEVTYQMVLNFLSGGAAINVFARQHNIGLRIVDAGVNYDFENADGLLNYKVSKGTGSFLNGPAMSIEACQTAFDHGKELINEIYSSGTNIIGFGEMGIGNTASAAMLMHSLTGISLEDCVGRGTGLDDKKYKTKVEILRQSLKQNGIPKTPMEALCIYSGFEIAMMCGAMLSAAANQMVILVDGFIASAAYLVANKLDSNIKHYTIFCHQSEEKGHQQMLSDLGVKPILNLNLRLGEGTGCVLAYPIIESALNFLNQMASFESAGVSEKD